MHSRTLSSPDSPPSTIGGLFVIIKQHLVVIVCIVKSIYNRSFTLSGGNTIVVAGKSSREHVNFVPTVVGTAADNSIIASSVNDDADDDGAVMTWCFNLLPFTI